MVCVVSLVKVWNLARLLVLVLQDMAGSGKKVAAGKVDEEEEDEEDSAQFAMHYESLEPMIKHDIIKQALSAGILATIEAGADGAMAFNTIEQLRRSGLNKALNKWCELKGVAYNPFKIADKQVVGMSLLLLSVSSGCCSEAI